MPINAKRPASSLFISFLALCIVLCLISLQPTRAFTYDFNGFDQAEQLQEIADALRQHLESVQDMTAQVTLTQFSPRDGSQNLGALKLEAIFPDLVRATWQSPEIYAGVFLILDSAKNTYTEYVPAMGEAHRIPLDQLLNEQDVLQLAPEQLFALPSPDDYDLKILPADDQPVGHMDSEHYVIVEAIEKNERQQTFTLWVDTDRWLVTRIEESTAQGKIMRVAEASDIVINQNLQANALRHLPPGTVERSRF